MKNRRDFLKSGLYGAGALALMPGAFAAANTGKPPMRFIFMHKGNGLLPSVMVPPTFSDAQKAADKKKEKLEVALDKHELPGWMQPISAHKENMTILQGISGKMCTVGHHSWCSALGAYKANERLSTIKWATVDFELAKLFPSPMEHIELACFPNGGGNSRGNINGIEKGFSARGPQQPNYAFGSPKVALQELFKSVSADKKARIQYELERKVLAFRANTEAGLSNGLNGLEKAKVQNYAESIEAIRERNKKIDAMASVIRKHIPKLDKKYLADEMFTTDRQLGHTEILLSALISGLTNVVAFTVDELGTTYTGLPGIENDKVNLHDVGHNKPVGKFDALTVRDKVRNQHMKVMDIIVKRLKSVPEGNGTMFDNTVIFYQPDGGETHHSHGWEYPFVIMSGKNAKMDIAGRYIRLPYHNQEGCKTLGNLWTTVLNAYGNPIKHFGDFDLSLKVGQSGPIKQFLA